MTKYIYYNNAFIKRDNDCSFVYKKSNVDLLSLFNKLKSYSFYNMPNIIKIKEDEIIFEYVHEDKIDTNVKYEHLAKCIALLHLKTEKYKETSQDDYQKIYDLIKDNIYYLKHYYEGLFLLFIKKEYHNPSEYLFLRNFYKIKEVLNYTQKELNIWYEMVKNKKNQRVSILHNNICLKHFIYNKDKSVLISWDNYKSDSPVLDIVNFYHNEYMKTDFSIILKLYLNNYKLNEEELKLLFILISIPNKIQIKNNMDSIIEINNLIEYILKTEELIRPYYAKNDVK